MTEETQVKEKAPKVEQNGVTRPKAGTDTGRIWEIADSISAASQRPAGRAEVLAEAEKKKLNPATAATQFGRWCKFHGVKPTPKPAVDKTAEKAAKKAAKEAEKAAKKAAKDAEKAAKAAEANAAAPVAPAEAEAPSA